MRKNLSGHDDGDFVHRISDHLAVDSDGNMMRISVNLAVEMDSGALPVVATWKNEEEDD